MAIRNHIKVKWFVYFSMKIKDNETKAVTKTIKSSELCDNSSECNYRLSQGIPLTCICTH